MVRSRKKRGILPPITPGANPFFPESCLFVFPLPSPPQQLLRSVALFVGSVFFMRNYGEVMVA